MGGTMKGAHGNIHAAYSSSRRKWSNVYVVMVVVCSVFGCLILGLMGLHRLRERNSLNLLLKEKDNQILSLHHLLQKERGHVEEVKRKTDEMKTKIMNLGSEKSDLNIRISEMQSTISSLREEQRTVESAFQEKQNEANLLREKYTQVNDQNPQLEALKEELRQKQGEIEDLKHRLQLHGAEVRSVSENQPSNATTEATATESEAKKEVSASGENESSTTSTEAIQTGSENGGTNAGDEVEPQHEKEHEHLGKEEQTLSQTQSSDNQEQGVVHQGWKKMENEENSRRFRGRRGYLRRAKGKRWRSIGKHVEGKMTSLSNRASTMADQGSLNATQSQGTEDLRREALINSSLEKTHSSLEELAKNSAMRRMDGVKHTEETEHLEEQISIKKPTEDENEKQDTDLLERKEVSGGNGEEQDSVLSRDSEESEDKEETEELEFKF